MGVSPWATKLSSTGLSSLPVNTRSGHSVPHQWQPVWRQKIQYGGDLQWLWPRLWLLEQEYRQVVTRRESNVKSERVSAVSKNAVYRQCIVTYYWWIEYQPNQGIFGGFDSMLSLNAFMMSKRGSLSKFDKRERFEFRQCTAVCFCLVRNKGVNTSPVLTYCVCYL